MCSFYFRDVTFNKLDESESGGGAEVDPNATELEKAQHKASAALRTCLFRSESCLRDAWKFLSAQWRALVECSQRRSEDSTGDGRKKDKDKDKPKKKESWLQRRKKKEGGRPVGARERERETSGAWYRPEGGLPAAPGAPSGAEAAAPPSAFTIRNDSDDSEDDDIENPLFGAQNLRRAVAEEEAAGLVYVEHSGRDDDTDTQRYISSKPSRTAAPLATRGAAPPLLSQKRETSQSSLPLQSTSPTSRPDTTAFPTHTARRAPPPLLSQQTTRRLTTPLENTQSQSDSDASAAKPPPSRGATVWQVAPGRVLTVNPRPSRSNWDDLEPESSGISESSDNAFEM
jgi:hypothetical protein